MAFHINWASSEQSFPPIELYGLLDILVFTCVGEVVKLRKKLFLRGPPYKIFTGVQEDLDDKRGFTLIPLTFWVNIVGQIA